MKKLLLVLVLALQAAVVAGVASADNPWPPCIPCDIDTPTGK